MLIRLFDRGDVVLRRPSHLPSLHPLHLVSISISSISPPRNKQPPSFLHPGAVAFFFHCPSCYSPVRLFSSSSCRCCCCCGDSNREAGDVRCEERETRFVRSFWVVFWMVDMEEKREKKLVVGLTRRHMIRSGSSSPPPAATDSNRNGSEVGDYISELRQKKEKKDKALKRRSSNSDMNNGNGEAEGSDGDCDDTVFSSLTAASFSNLISSRKRVRTLGKVAEDCDAVDPPVPRKLRSAINKRAGRTISSSPQHVKKRRHLSAISAQIFLMDRETRFNESSLSNSFTKEEELLADTLLSLSQIPPLCEPMADRAVAEDSSNINVASTSCSEGAIKEDDKTTVLPTAANEVATHPAHADQPVERTGSVPQINPALVAPHKSINPHLLKDGQIQELPLGIVTNLPSPSKDSSNNSAHKQLNGQFDDSLTNPSKKEDPQWLVYYNKPDFVVYDGKKIDNNSAQEIAPLVQTPLSCTSHGYSIKTSSSMFGVHINPATETAKASATGNSDKLSLSKSGDLKTWKKSVTHVYVSHLIQTHLNKDKASQNQVKPNERSQSRISQSPNISTLNKNNVQDKRFYAANCHPTLPVQPSSGICDMAAGGQKMVSSNFLNLPTSAASSGAQHVQYLHPQITHRGAMPYPYPHLPCSRGHLASAVALQQQMQQYMCNPGSAPHPSLPASPAVMKPQQFAPTPHQQQQQMWQFHFSQYQPRPDGTAPEAWQNSPLQDMSSLRPMLVLPPPAMPSQMDLLCAPYQGGSRRPPQLRLI